jgi:hypothetical protein
MLLINLLPINLLPINLLPINLLPINLLPINLLPINLLPIVALNLIREYSKPVTRPDWRTFDRIMSIENFMFNIQYNFCVFHSPLYSLVLQNMYSSEFYISYQHIYNWGIDSYINVYGGNKKVLLSNKLLNHQQNLYLKSIL